MRLRVARQGVLAANVANADTPGYRSADLAFDAALARTVAPSAPAHPRHLPVATAAPGWRVVPRDGAPRPDGNDVNVDRELIALTRNAGEFRQQAEVLSRLIALRQLALGRGR
jgi:flagellar basal-body rod protein FlgB